MDQKTFQVQAQEFIADFLPQWLKPLEKILATNGNKWYSSNEKILAEGNKRTLAEDNEKILATKGNKWYSGNSATFADIAIMVILDFIHRDYMTFKGLNNLEERRLILNEFPCVKANYERTSKLSSVLSWKKEKPKFAGL